MFHELCNYCRLESPQYCLFDFKIGKIITDSTLTPAEKDLAIEQERQIARQRNCLYIDDKIPGY